MSKSPSVNLLEAYDAYSDAIFRYCFVRVRNREVALDLMQEAFIKTWEYLRTDHTVQNMRAFLYKVAGNLVIDYSRKKKESSLDTLMDRGFDVVTEDQSKIHDSLDVQYALAVVNQLDEKYRDVIVMRYVHELSIGEIAEIIQESENVVSVRLHRGLQQIRKLFEEK